MCAERLIETDPVDTTTVPIAQRVEEIENLLRCMGRPRGRELGYLRQALEELLQRERALLTDDARA